jgi:hypothetical protein
MGHTAIAMEAALFTKGLFTIIKTCRLSYMPVMEAMAYLPMTLKQIQNHFIAFRKLFAFSTGYEMAIELKRISGSNKQEDSITYDELDLISPVIAAVRVFKITLFLT